MPIPFTCSCGRTLRVKDEFAGRKVRCPGCAAVIDVPKKDDDVLDVAVLVEDDAPRKRSQDVQREPAESDRPKRPVPRDDDEDDEPDEPRPKPKRKKPKVASDRGWFGDVNGSVIGGLVMMLIAVAWFVGGLFAGIIFFYPPVLFIIGIVAFFRGVTGGGD